MLTFIALAGVAEAQVQPIGTPTNFTLGWVKVPYKFTETRNLKRTHIGFSRKGNSKGPLNASRYASLWYQHSFHEMTISCSSDSG
jgi:hypothetical protein